MTFYTLVITISLFMGYYYYYYFLFIVNLTFLTKSLETMWLMDKFRKEINS